MGRGKRIRYQEVPRTTTCGLSIPRAERLLRKYVLKKYNTHLRVKVIYSFRDRNQMNRTSWQARKFPPYVGIFIGSFFNISIELTHSVMCLQKRYHAYIQNTHVVIEISYISLNIVKILIVSQKKVHHRYLTTL